MKKTLVALAVATIAASANATTVYDNNGTKVSVEGRLDLILGSFGKAKQNVQGTKENRASRFDLRNNSSRIEFKAEHDLGEGLKAIAFTRLGFLTDADDTLDDTRNLADRVGVERLWLALDKEGVGRVSFGKQNTSADDVELNDHSYAFGGNNNLLNKGEKVVAFRSTDYQLAEGHTLSFGADYILGNSNKYDNQDTVKYAYGASAFYDAKFGDIALSLAGGYVQALYDDGKGKTTYSKYKSDSWRLASQLASGPVTFGIEYGESYYKEKLPSKKSGDKRALEVAAKYQYLDNASVYAIWLQNRLKGKTAGLVEAVAGTTLANGAKKTTNTYLLGTDYSFSKNVVAYAELARELGKEVSSSSITKSNNTKYGVGLRVYF